MPVRSLNSSVLKWPNAQTVDHAIRDWANRIAQTHPGVQRIGYFGSYARGDWGVGSDLDVLVIVDQTPMPFERRAVEWDTTELPVPTDVLVYTLEEWHKLQNKFRQTVEREIIWVLSNLQSEI